MYTYQFRFIRGGNLQELSILENLHGAYGEEPHSYSYEPMPVGVKDDQDLYSVMIEHNFDNDQEAKTYAKKILDQQDIIFSKSKIYRIDDNNSFIAIPNNL